MNFKYLLHHEVEESNNGVKDCDSDTRTPYQIKVIMKPLGLPQYRKLYAICHQGLCHDMNICHDIVAYLLTFFSILAV